jgi:hypothetical protein
MSIDDTSIITQMLSPMYIHTYTHMTQIKTKNFQPILLKLGFALLNFIALTRGSCCWPLIGTFKLADAFQGIGSSATKWKQRIFLTLSPSREREKQCFHYGAPGLPDFCWYVIPKPEKCTKSTQNIPNGHKISQMSLKYSKWP